MSLDIYILSQSIEGKTKYGGHRYEENLVFENNFINKVVEQDQALAELKEFEGKFVEKIVY